MKIIEMENEKNNKEKKKKKHSKDEKLPSFTNMISRNEKELVNARKAFYFREKFKLFYALVVILLNQFLMILLVVCSKGIKFLQ